MFNSFIMCNGRVHDPTRMCFLTSLRCIFNRIKNARSKSYMLKYNTMTRKNYSSYIFLRDALPRVFFSFSVTFLPTSQLRTRAFAVKRDGGCRMMVRTLHEPITTRNRSRCGCICLLCVVQLVSEITDRT